MSNTPTPPSHPQQSTEETTSSTSPTSGQGPLPATATPAASSSVPAPQGAVAPIRLRTLPVAAATADPASLITEAAPGGSSTIPSAAEGGENTSMSHLRAAMASSTSRFPPSPAAAATTTAPKPRVHFGPTPTVEHPEGSGGPSMMARVKAVLGGKRARSKSTTSSGSSSSAGASSTQGDAPPLTAEGEEQGAVSSSRPLIEQPSAAVGPVPEGSLVPAGQQETRPIAIPRALSPSLTFPSPSQAFRPPAQLSTVLNFNIPYRPVRTSQAGSFPPSIQAGQGEQPSSSVAEYVLHETLPGFEVEDNFPGESLEAEPADHIKARPGYFAPYPYYYDGQENIMYKLRKILSAGGAATVIKARAQGRQVEDKCRCIKLMKRDRLNTLKRELRGLTMARDGGDHENIIRFYGAWGQEGHLVMALELAERSLADILIERGNQLPKLFKQIVA
ncbi:hypothetical protein BGX23_009219, partial [Mortierella sp. AD031]